jgi:hypothetical protein
MNREGIATLLVVLMVFLSGPVAVVDSGGDFIASDRDDIWDGGFNDPR